MKPLAFLEEVTKRPATQRKVLVPLIAWQLSVERPGFVLEGALLDAVNQLLTELNPNEGGMGDRLEAKLKSAGVTPALLREIQLKANLPPLGDATFEPRRPPQPGEVTGGPMAQHTLKRTP